MKRGANWETKEKRTIYKWNYYNFMNEDHIPVKI